MDEDEEEGELEAKGFTLSLSFSNNPEYGTTMYVLWTMVPLCLELCNRHNINTSLKRFDT